MPPIKVACPHPGCTTTSIAQDEPYLCPGCNRRIVVRMKPSGSSMATPLTPPAAPLSLDDAPPAPPERKPRKPADLRKRRSEEDFDPLLHRPERRSYTGWVVGGVAAVVLVGAVAFILGRQKPDPTAPPPKEPAAEVAAKPAAPTPADAADPDAADLAELAGLAVVSAPLPAGELFDRAARGTVFVFPAEESSRRFEKARLGWVANRERGAIVTRAEVVGAWKKAVVVFPAFDAAGRLIPETRHYRNGLAYHAAEVAFDAELVAADPDREFGLAVLQLKPKPGQSLPAELDQLPLATAVPGVGEPVLCPDVSGWGADPVFALREGQSKGAALNGTLLETVDGYPDGHPGVPLLNARGEVAATLIARNADGKGRPGGTGGAVRQFLRQTFRQAGWAWADAPASARYEPADRLKVYLTGLSKATPAGQLVAAGADLPAGAVVTPVARDRQVHYLRRVGELQQAGKPAAGAVAAYLRSPDPAVRNTALQVLFALRAAGDLDQSTFSDSLRTGWSVEARTYAAWAYGRVAAPADALAKLADLLAEADPRDERAGLRVSALEAVAHNAATARRSTARRVIDALDDKAAEVRKAAADALVALLTQPEGLADDLRDKVEHDPPEYRKEEGWGPVAHQPAGAGGRAAAARLLAFALDPKKVQYAWFRAAFFPRLTDRPGTPGRVADEALARELRVTAARGLARWGRQAADCLRPDPPLGGLVDLLADPVQEVRLAAVDAVGRVGARAGGRLAVADGTVTGVEEVDLPAALDRLADADPDDGVRLKARAVALALMEAEPSPRDVPLLRKALRPAADKAERAAHDADRRRAARLLAAVAALPGGPTAVAAARPELVAAAVQPEAAGDPDPALQVDALKVLEAVGEALAADKEGGPAVAKTAAGLLTAGGPAAAPAGGGADAAARLLRSTVWVHTDRGDGTGVVIDGGGWPLVLTNHHVVADARTVTVYFPVLTANKEANGEASYYRANEPALRKSRQAQTAAVVEAAADKDLAVLKLSDPLPAGAAPVRLAPAGAASGQRLHLRGMSGVLDGTLWRYSNGAVRQVMPAAEFEYQGGQQVRCKAIEHDMATNPGDSGGAVVNDRGELVALNCARNRRSQGVGVAIDRDEVAVVLRKLGRSAGGPAAGPGGAGEAAPDVRAAAVGVLRALGPASAVALGEALRRPAGRGQAVLICDTLRGFAERSRPADHPDLVTAAKAFVLPAAADLDDDGREAASRLVATVGGLELVAALIDRTASTVGGVRAPAAARLWAVRTLGRLDPASVWLSPAEVRRQVLASPALKAKYREYVEDGAIDDREAAEVRKKVLKAARECLVGVRDWKKNEKELVEAAADGLLQLDRDGVK